MLLHLVPEDPQPLREQIARGEFVALTVARDDTGEPMGYEALESMISAEPPTDSPSTWLAGLSDRVQQHSVRTLEDDWTAAMLVPREPEGAS